MWGRHVGCRGELHRSREEAKKWHGKLQHCLHVLKVIFCRHRFLSTDAGFDCEFPCLCDILVPLEYGESLRNKVISYEENVSIEYLVP